MRFITALGYSRQDALAALRENGACALLFCRLLAERCRLIRFLCVACLRVLAAA